jgi:adenine-specific DNA glycosylase
MQAALDDHYQRHPRTRPDLADLAIAAAELDGHPLASQHERLRQAAAEIAKNHPGASPDDVLLWAEARALPAA